MRYRELGNTGWQVSVLSLGGASWMSRVGRKESELAIRCALEQGINFFDTAPMYGQGESEAILGRLAKSVDQRIYISTKVGQVVPRAVRMLNPIKPLVRQALKPFQADVRRAVGGILTSQTRSHQFDPSSIRASVEESLGRMRRESIELLLLHSPSVHVIQSMEFINPLEILQAQGKIRRFGIACDSVETVNATAKLPKGSISAVQIELSEESYPELENALKAFAANGVGVIARSLLPRNILHDRSEVDRRILNAIECPEIASTLIGMTRPEHIAHNCALVDRTKIAAPVRRQAGRGRR